MPQLGVPPDVKQERKPARRPAGFEIRSKGECISFCWGITNHKWLIDFLTFTTT